MKALWEQKTAMQSTGAQSSLDPHDPVALVAQHTGVAALNADRASNATCEGKRTQQLEEVAWHSGTRSERRPGPKAVSARSVNKKTKRRSVRPTTLLDRTTERQNDSTTERQGRVPGTRGRHFVPCHWAHGRVATSEIWHLQCHSR